MKGKETITKDNYKEKTLKRAIIICWILLAICFIVKICGGNFFNIVCNNENFIKFCNYCDTSFIRYVIYFTYFMFESIILLLIIRPNTKVKSKRFLFYCLCVFIYWIVKVLQELNIIKPNFILVNIIPFIVLYGLLALFSKRPLASIIVIIYQFVLVTLSSVIRNISLNGIITESFLISFIFSIDYYILLILTLLYRKVIFYKRRNKDGINELDSLVV